jgi:hypothetical protein
MSSEHEELAGYQYLVKYIERGVVVMDKIRNGTDLLEEDESYLKSIHKVHFSGEYPIFRVKAAINDEVAVQQGLFTPMLPKDPVHDDLAL